MTSAGITQGLLLAAALLAQGTGGSGKLEMAVRYHGGEPAVGVQLRAEQRSLASAHAFPWFAVSDERGIATFPQLPAGKFMVEGDRSGFALLEVEADSTTKQGIELDIGVEVTGSVLDAQRQPVASAEIWLFQENRSRRGACVATSDAAGAFALRGVVPGSWLQARTTKFAPTRLVRIESPKFEGVRVELVASDVGATLRGRVLTPAGVPAASAAVCVMDPVVPQESPAHWFTCVTNSAGRFELVGLPSGTLRLVALAPNIAPLDERIELSSSAPVERELCLQLGCTVQGIVFDSRGKPTPYATVHYGDWRDFVCLKTSVAEDGSYQLSGLPSGHVKLRARGFEEVLELKPTSVATWSPKLPPAGGR